MRTELSKQVIVYGAPSGCTHEESLSRDEAAEMISNSRNGMRVEVQMESDGREVPVRFFVARSIEDLDKFKDEGGIAYALINWGRARIVAHSARRAEQLRAAGWKRFPTRA
jgi:hypothetical protein